MYIYSSTWGPQTVVKPAKVGRTFMTEDMSVLVFSQNRV